MLSQYHFLCELLLKLLKDSSIYGKGEVREVISTALLFAELLVPWQFKCRMKTHLYLMAFTLHLNNCNGLHKLQDGEEIDPGQPYS